MPVSSVQGGVHSISGGSTRTSSGRGLSVRKDPVWDLLEEMAVLLDRFAARPPSADPGLRRHPLSVREAFRKLDDLRAKRERVVR
jgi:hypothetical protein